MSWRVPRYCTFYENYDVRNIIFLAREYAGACPCRSLVAFARHLLQKLQHRSNKCLTRSRFFWRMPLYSIYYSRPINSAVATISEGTVCGQLTALFEKCLQALLSDDCPRADFQTTVRKHSFRAIDRKHCFRTIVRKHCFRTVVRKCCCRAVVRKHRFWTIAFSD